MAVTALHQWLVPVILSLNQVSYSSPKLCFLIQVTLKLHVNRKDVGCFCLLQYLCALKSCSTCKSHSKHCVLWCWATLADPRKSPLSFLFIHVLHKGKFVVWHESIHGFRGSPDCWQESHWVMFDTGSVLQVIHALFILFISLFSYTIDFTTCYAPIALLVITQILSVYITGDLIFSPMNLMYLLFLNELENELWYQIIYFFMIFCQLFCYFINIYVHESKAEHWCMLVLTHRFMAGSISL